MDAASMSETSPSAVPPAPIVDPSAIKEIAPGVFVICDRRVPLVPNIGIILGSNAALVVDTGMGRRTAGRSSTPRGGSPASGPWS
jgi:hypothetical protein